MTLPTFINGHAATAQEVHEFVRAKQSRGELVNYDLVRGARADGRVRTRGQLALLRAQLRENPAFARASEQIDRFEAALIRRRGIPLPLPVQLKQETDGTLGLVWPGITVAVDGDVFLSIIAKDREDDVCQGENPEVLDALAELDAAQAARW